MSGAPRTTVAGRPARGRAGGSAGGLLPLARPLRARAATSARRRAAVGRLRRHRDRPAPRGRRRLRRGASPTTGCSSSAPRWPRRPARGSSSSCCCGGVARSSTASSTASCTPGMVGVGFAFTENILYLASAYNGSRNLGPGGVDALIGDLRRCAAWSARSPTRCSRRARASGSGSPSRRGAGPCASSRPIAGSPVPCCPRDLEHRDGLRAGQLRPRRT